MLTAAPEVRTVCVRVWLCLCVRVGCCDGLYECANAVGQSCTYLRSL